MNRSKQDAKLQQQLERLSLLTNAKQAVEQGQITSQEEMEKRYLNIA